MHVAKTSKKRNETGTRSSECKANSVYRQSFSSLFVSLKTIECSVLPIFTRRRSIPKYEPYQIATFCFQIGRIVRNKTVFPWRVADCSEDMYAHDSIQLLKNSGIDFEVRAWVSMQMAYLFVAREHRMCARKAKLSFALSWSCASTKRV